MAGQTDQLQFRIQQELIAICAARQGHSLQKWENLNNCESRIASRVEGILYFLELVLGRLFKISA